MCSQSCSKSAVVVMDSGLALRAPRNDGERHSRGAMRPSSANTSAPVRAWGMPGVDAPAASRANDNKAHERSHHRSTGSARHSRTQWFTVYSALSSVTGLVCHRRLRVDPANLTPASGRQDHTALPSALVSSSFDTTRVHRIPRPTSVTTAKRPFVRARDSGAYRSDLGQTRSDIFLQPGLDSFG